MAHSSVASVRRLGLLLSYQILKVIAGGVQGSQAYPHRFGPALPRPASPLALHRPASPVPPPAPGPQPSAQDSGRSGSPHRVGAAHSPGVGQMGDRAHPYQGGQALPFRPSAPGNQPSPHRQSKVTGTGIRSSGRSRPRPLCGAVPLVARRRLPSRAHVSTVPLVPPVCDRQDLPGLPLLKSGKN